MLHRLPGRFPLVVPTAECAASSLLEHDVRHLHVWAVQGGRGFRPGVFLPSRLTGDLLADTLENICQNNIPDSLEHQIIRQHLLINQFKLGTPLPEVTPDEVKAHIKSIKNKKAPGHNLAIKFLPNSSYCGSQKKFMLLWT